MKSSIIISGETEEIFNFIPTSEELQILGEMGTDSNPSPSKCTLAMVLGGAWYVLQETA